MWTRKFFTHTLKILASKSYVTEAFWNGFQELYMDITCHFMKLFISLSNILVSDIIFFKFLHFLSIFIGSTFRDLARSTCKEKKVNLEQRQVLLDYYLQWGKILPFIFFTRSIQYSQTCLKGHLYITNHCL